MALTGIKKRLWNPGNNIIGDTDGILSNLNKRSIITSKQGGRGIEVFWSGTAEDSEAGGAADSVFDGTTTPLSLYIVSASASDVNTAAGHVRKVAVIGLAVKNLKDFYTGVESADLYVEVIEMNGTTNVRTQLYFLRVIHMYAIQWGSGDDDAAGAITLESPENTTLINININENESQGGLLFFPEGSKVAVIHASIDINAVPTVADGVAIEVAYENFDLQGDTDGDFNTRSISAHSYVPHYQTDRFDAFAKRAMDGAKITITINLFGDAAPANTEFTLLISG
jgi:hypothetical protein